ncbi:5-deoxy-glucuronate isomerase [Streptomyces avicenniae]|uniref:5-deoxy-glucuronate isomerase n=1 Tax=Streptomyces avicenniae TaxID=500153 RepID=UPI00069B794C|nr:5-deoxy-glucuronate isomerase [Streptomyces avicenniae]
MHVVTPAPVDVITTPNAVMTRRATPAHGAGETAVWTARMAAGAQGPVHQVDREQIWCVLTGSITVTTDAGEERAVLGQTVVLPPGEDRRITAGEQGAELLVCMPVAGRVSTPDDPRLRPLPWAA